MLIECIQEFGNFKPGDTAEIPKDAVFDKFYFKAIRKAKPETTESE